MKTARLVLVVSISAGICFASALIGLAQEKKNADGGTDNKPKQSSSSSSAETSRPTAEDLETKFKAALTKATLSGRWCSVKDGQLGPDKEDKYTIVGVTKVGANTWLINARIQYGKVDVVAPIPVQVKWAGDTPVIIVDNVGIPGGNTYSARVMIYDKTYSGTWSGGDHGGMLHGVITNEKE